jgi:hypothetical protein
VGRVAGDRLELLDGNGQLVARTGDHLQAAGGFATIDGQEGFNVCPVGIVVAPGPPP